MIEASASGAGNTRDEIATFEAANGLTMGAGLNVIAGNSTLSSGELETTAGSLTLTSFTGNVYMGNYSFESGQTVGAGQDNYVLKYDNGTGFISLEPDATGGGGGGGGDVYKNGTPVNEQVAVWLNDSTVYGSANFTFNGSTLYSNDIETDNGIEFVNGATNQADIYWDVGLSDLIYRNNTAASSHIFTNSVGTNLFEIHTGTNEVTVQNDLRVNGDFLDNGGGAGTAGQVPISSGSGSGFAWGTITGGIDSLELDTSPELGGDLDLGGNAFTETFTAGATITFRDFCTIDTDAGDGRVYETDADDETRASGYVFWATEAGTTGNPIKVITEGIIDGWVGLTPGAIYWLNSVSGKMDTTKPNTSGQIVRKIGQAISSTQLYFKPDETWVEVP